MRNLHFTCQGESHKAINKVCQDYSFSRTTKGASIAVVCDGHGGNRYFRSDVGAKFATDITVECVESFLNDVNPSIWDGESLVQRSALTTDAKQNNFYKSTKIDNALRQLFSSIIYKWQREILKHASNTPLSDIELKTLSSEYIDDFNNNHHIEKTYGCTLMCCVIAEQFWFAFHVGDGKCIAFDNNGCWSEPIPWDEKCFLNKTTSICDSNVSEEFRYCYQSDGNFPLAVFLGSDGIDDSFGETENMVNFYIQFLKLIDEKGHSDALKSLEETLPQLSQIGSKDDMSVACVYNENTLADKVKLLVLWQQKSIEDKIMAINNRIVILRESVARFEGRDLNDQKDQIEFQYAQKDLIQAYDTKRSLANKWNKFAQELDGDNAQVYTDDIGYEIAADIVEPNVDEAKVDDNNE